MCSTASLQGPSRCHNSQRSTAQPSAMCSHLHLLRVGQINTGKKSNMALTHINSGEAVKFQHESQLLYCKTKTPNNKHCAVVDLLKK